MPNDTDSPATPPTPPTHQDVVDALRVRIIKDCADRGHTDDPGAGTAELAALVSAYNGTDARESAFINDNIRAVLDRVLYANPRPSAGELRESILLAFAGKRDPRDWTGVGK